MQHDALGQMRARVDHLYRDQFHADLTGQAVWMNDAAESANAVHGAFNTQSVPYNGNVGCINACTIYGVRGRDGKNVSCSDCPPGPIGPRGFDGVAKFFNASGQIPSVVGPGVWAGSALVVGAAGQFTVNYSNAGFSRLLFITGTPIRAATTSITVAMDGFQSATAATATGRVITGTAARNNGDTLIFAPAGTLVYILVIGQ